MIHFSGFFRSICAFMLRHWNRASAAVCACFAAYSLSHAARVDNSMRRLEWEKIKIDDGAFESAAAFDVNNDGKLDIVCGAYWYEAPNWTKHKMCDVRAEGEYYDDFSTIAIDINGDGYIDIVTGGWWGATLVWRENPRGQRIEWQTHEIDQCGNIETARAWDIDGDGQLEICPNTPGTPLRFYKLVKKGKEPKWRKIFVQREGASGHGLGFGDVNGDGRGDFVVSNGWWESPADPLSSEWIFHQEFNLGSASVPIIVDDFNKDGLPELIVGQAHGYGLDYYTQMPEKNTRKWVKHPIDPYFSQYHEMVYADIDGDGEKEIVTGNRYRAHCGTEPGETDIVGLYYFKWNGESWTKCVIDYGKAGQHSGTGIFMHVVDIDRDGRLDIVAPGKEGLFLFRNLGPEQVGTKK